MFSRFAPPVLSLIVTLALAASSLDAKTVTTKFNEATNLFTDTRVWIGSEGEPLPFEKDEEILDFLRTARVVEMEGIPTGVTRPRKVLLEKEGVRAYACFRDVDIRENKAVLPKIGIRRHWRDSHQFECAAYELARLLGLNNIPPVVIRKIGDTQGSLQIWLERATMETVRARKSLDPPDVWRHKMQWEVMRVFDALIHNDDRNAGNVLYDEDWTLWMIDHTRSFPRVSDLSEPPQFQYCPRTFWEKLRNLDEHVLKEHLGQYLESAELKALIKRRDKLTEYIQEEIERRGERQVLFAFR